MTYVHSKSLSVCEVAQIWHTGDDRGGGYVDIVEAIHFLFGEKKIN